MIDILTTGGAQKLLVTFGRDAAHYGIETEIVCLNPEEISPVGKELQEIGLKVIYFPADHLMDLNRLRKVKKYLRLNRPDVIQTHLLYANVVGGIAGFLAGIPVISTLHSTGPNPSDSKARNWVEAQVMKFFNRRVIAVGYKTAEVHQPRVMNKKIDVVPNAVGSPIILNESEKKVIRKEIMGDENRLMLISVGKFSPIKAYGDLIQAFALISPQYPQAILVFVGDGDQRLELMELSKNLNIENSIKFIGKRNDVPSLLAASDLFISSSIVEGMPLVIMEAMMAGLPIVSTSVGDLPFMVNQDCGILVPPSKPELLAIAIGTMLMDPDKMKVMGESSHKFAEDNYSSSTWMKRLIQMYSEVMN